MSNTQYFLIRRLHSLLGIIPLGLFLFAHLTTNAMALFGEDAFVHKVELIHSLGPLLPFVEAGMIFIPLSLHIIIGIFIALQSKNNQGDLGYKRNWAYTLQRWSGWLALVFILYHTITLRFIGTAGHTAQDFFDNLTVQFQNPLFILAYLAGTAAVVYHFANGICTFCMTWGITVGEKSQKIMAYVATAVGLALMGMAISSIAGFYFHYDGSADQADSAAISIESSD